MHLRALTAILLCSAGLAGAPRLSLGQTFVYDTRSIALSGSANNFIPGLIGGIGTTGDHYKDAQAADDFTLPNRTRLTRVTVDMIQEIAGNWPPNDGFLVEIFTNLPSNKPAESPAYSEIVTTFSVEPGTFTANAPIPNGDRMTYTLTLGPSAIFDAGVWWISIVPKDMTPFGSYYDWVGLTANTSGFGAYRRCGGLDHGDGFGCDNSTANAVPDWAAANGFASRARTLSMRIEGDVLVGGACCSGTSCSTAASASACLGGSSYQGDGSTCGPSGNPTSCCPANFNGVNGLNVQDIFDFLGAWFASDPRADFNRANGIGVQDIFDFLAAWFVSC